MAAALLIQRLSIAAFLAVWTSLKFLRPEWFGNVYKPFLDPAAYGVDWTTLAQAVGWAQAALVVLFVLGLFRTPVYALVTAVHATGVLNAAVSGRLIDWSDPLGNPVWVNFPNNLLWTSVATLGALVALFIMRRADRYTLDGLVRERRPHGARAS